MGVSVKKVTCVYCRGEVEETYSHSTWKSKAECTRCGTKWEKQFDEYDLINMRITRGYGAVFVLDNNQVIDVDLFYQRPTQDEAIERLNNMSSKHEYADSCFVVLEEEGKWIKRYANGNTEDLI